MSTLIIHPQDHSTDFLDIVYKDIPNKLVIRNSFSKDDIKELIVEFDRVMMMGHGSPSGLFSVGQFDVDGAFIIDNSFVDILSEKEDSVYIWCHADQFVEANNLKGFYSGMFISEVGEAMFCGVMEANQKMVDESNYGFCDMLAKVINEKTTNLYSSIMRDYGELANINKVASYNVERLKFKVI